MSEIVETDDLVLDTKDIRKPTLGDAASKRHLPALEMGLAATWSVVTAASLDSLVSLARSLASARARTTSEPLAIAVRSRSGNQIVKADATWRSQGFPTCWFVCHSLFLYRRHFYEVTHVLDLSAQRG
jgi:hypothetical protein